MSAVQQKRQDISVIGLNYEILRPTFLNLRHLECYNP